ncbi:NERD domain-containing protein [Bowmanella pacifica]|uniref:NERD domain-containing protein n=1 Tax=Bowmanella pacifica TaxID=502051 RepID=UPI001E6584A8|nr:NERD domain-containing protein [Bowmanella pacifica]
MEQLLSEAVKMMWWLVPIALLAGFIKSPWFKGWFGEALVKLFAKFRLPTDVYHPIHNVTLPTVDGTTQIDHIFVSRFGVFVVETKNVKGWIYGNERQAQWTQKIFKQSFKFQNPLHQNFKHVKTLEQLMELPSEVIHSVVVFTGDCTFKTAMPANVTQAGSYTSYIKSFKTNVLSDTDVQRIVDRVISTKLDATWQTHRQHVRHLQSRNDPSSNRKCPRCGSEMVLRTSSKGKNVGNQFWGCSAFPKCRMVRNAR